MGKKHVKRSVFKVKSTVRAIEAINRLQKCIPWHVSPLVEKKQEPIAEEDGDPKILLKNYIYEVIKNGFSLAYSEEEQLRINVDNIYPLLKALGLSPQNERVMDLVRDACMESSGDIDAKDFDAVILSLIKEKDEELWQQRLEEKAELVNRRVAETAEAEAEKRRLEEEREKAGFERDEVEEEEMEEVRRQKTERESEKERKQDELYDNLKMAFRFIDADEDGLISVGDIYNMMMGLGQMLTDDELFGMFTLADVDCDGKLTFDDFKNFLMPKEAVDDTGFISEENVDAQDQQTEQKPDCDDKNSEFVKDSTTNKKVPAGQPEVQSNLTSEPGKPTPEQEAIRKRRKQNMLYGYMTSAAKTVTENETIDETDAADSGIKETSQPAPTVKVEVVEESVEEFNAQPDSLECPLDAIREEDEHSNYGVEHSNKDAENAQCSKIETKLNTSVENKKKLLSRQNSSASLKARPSSAITVSESVVADSGISTLDITDTSDLREEPDVFDISDIGSEDHYDKDNTTSITRTPINSPRVASIYTPDVDDEDMIDEKYVVESLSRVSSARTAKPREDIYKEEPVFIKTNKYAEERTRHFVNEHMYTEVTATKSKLDLDNNSETNERLQRVKPLQKAILKRANTAPVLSLRYTSKPLPTVSMPAADEVQCSHVNIDIDLTGNSPPKAGVKSYRQFKEIMQNSRKGGICRDPAFDGHKMSIVDISVQNLDTCINNVSEDKWPLRATNRPISPRRKFTGTKETENQPVRTQSARSPRAQSSPAPRNRLHRPQTANIPYSTSRRVMCSYSNINSDDQLCVTATKPFSNSDKLYPRKSQLTACHHGFKSIWPIGRNINVLQNKKPFESFEMNSYSRSIERKEFPFKSSRTPRGRTLPNDSTRKGTNVIKLELGTNITRPKIKKLSSLKHSISTPNTVRY